MAEKAWAVAFTADLKDYLRVKGGFAYSNEQATVNAGVSISW